MNLADFTLSALKGFAQEVSTWTNSGVLHSIEGHIAQIENAVATDVHAGETAAKAVLADLYGAFHSQGVTPAAPVEPTPSVVESNTPPVPTPPAASSEAPSTASAQPAAASSAPVTTEPTTAAADPTPAPSTITEASSAPSSTPSDSTAEAPAAPAEPTA